MQSIWCTCYVVRPLSEYPKRLHKPPFLFPLPHNLARLYCCHVADDTCNIHQFMWQVDLACATLCSKLPSYAVTCWVRRMMTLLNCTQASHPSHIQPNQIAQAAATSAVFFPCFLGTTTRTRLHVPEAKRG